MEKKYFIRNAITSKPKEFHLSRLWRRLILIMIPFVGIAEETGWRELLQPELDKRMPYPFSVLLTAAIWLVFRQNNQPNRDSVCKSYSINIDIM